MEVRSTKKRKLPLTREIIVQAALTLLDQVGYEALTTRRLAQRLGVKQPALYWHFAKKRDLADAVAAAMLSPEQWPGPTTPGLQPEEWLAARAHAFRRALLAHRDGALIHAGTYPRLEGAEGRLAALVEYGLSPDDGLRTLLAVSRYTVGCVLEEQARVRRPDGGTMTLSSASPTMLQARTVVQHRDPTANFDFGLRALIAGAMAHRRTERQAKKRS